ncbi:MAG: hypothetical protein AAGC45_05560 [Bacteroidota bacterium]
MPITVKGGVVSLSTDCQVKATVDNIDFPNSEREDGKVPMNAEGTMLLTNVPDKQNFAKGNVLDYRDSNRNNDSKLTVTSVVGSIKYKVKRTG